MENQPRIARGQTAVGEAAPRRTRDRRIALVTHGFTTGGGVPTVTRWLRDALTAAGGYAVDVYDLATSSTDASSRRLVAPASWLRRSLLEVPQHSSGPQHWGANAVELELMRYRPRRELSRALRQYDLVQVVAGGPAWACAVLGLGIPVVLQVATLVEWERRSLLATQSGPMRVWRSAMTSGVSRAERRALRQVDAVLVENPAMAAFTRSLGQSSVAIAPPGVDTSVFRPTGTGWNRQGHVLSVCRLADPRKGLDRMVEAYAELLRRYPEAPDLVLAGRGQMPESLTHLIAALGVTNRVAVRPNVEAADLIDLYRNASVFLQTSHEEGLGMSVLEAMACGLPVVSTATAGGAETVVDGATGWLVPLEPADRVATTVAARAHSLLVGDGDEFGRRGRRRCVDVFSTQVTLQKILETYHQVWSGPRQARI